MLQFFKLYYDLYPGHGPVGNLGPAKREEEEHKCASKLGSHSHQLVAPFARKAQLVRVARRGLCFSMPVCVGITGALVIV